MSDVRTDDIHGHHASAAAARRKLDELDEHEELQRQLPELRSRRDAILAEKAGVAAEIRGDGENSPSAKEQLTPAQAILNYGLELRDGKYVVARPAGPGEDPTRGHIDYNALIERLARREALHDRLVQLNLQLGEVNAAIAAIPPPMAVGDKAALTEDLRRRAGL